jgi:polyhydroxybutyrate depolymerase
MPTLTEHGFERCAERDDGVVVYPDGVDRNWDDDRVGVDSTAHQQRIDDVAFIGELVKRVSLQTAIDPRRVYVTGISNGAMMCYRLARELPGVFAAIAPVAGLLPEGAEAKAWPQPTSVLLLEGTLDPFMPFRGGFVGSERMPRGRVNSAADTVRFLVAQDSLPEKPLALNPPDGQDDLTWRGDLYGAAENGVAVASFAIEGGGHTWPGGRQYLPEKIVGRTSRVDACELIWSFFKRHPRP